jgi:hypothetical protein
MPVSTCKMSDEGKAKISDDPVPEKILEKRFGRFGCEYLVQWKEHEKLEARTFFSSHHGMVTTTDTWEKLENIGEYKHLVEEFEEYRSRRQKK